MTSRAVNHHIAAIVIMASTAVSCTTARTARRADLMGAAAAGLAKMEQLDRLGPVIVVLAPDADPEAREVFCTLRRCVSTTDVPASELYRLPVGYFSFEELRVVGDEGILIGILGPAERPRQDREIGDCGTHYRIALGQRPDGRWVTGPYEATIC